jgi:lactate permease
VSLVADIAPVAFGAIGIPIRTLAQVSGLPTHHLSQMVGRQTPFLALIIPFVLVLMVDGRRGLREAWPVALAAGTAFAIAQFVISNYVSMELTDIIASLVSAGAVVSLLRVWHPSAPSTPAAAVGRRPAVAGGSVGDAAFERRVGTEPDKPRRSEVLKAFAPYAIIVVVLGLTSLHPIQNQLDKATSVFTWPGLHVVNPKGKAPTSEEFKFTWLTATGTWLFVSGLLTALVLRVRPREALRIYLPTLDQIEWALLTVCAVLAVAYVMNLSGQTATLGTWAAGAGSFFAFLSPLIGWFGTAVTGSDTSTELAVRRPSGHRRAQGEAVAYVARGCQQLRGRDGEDGLASKPGDRRRCRWPGRLRRRHLPSRARLERRAGAADRAAGAASVGSVVMDGPVNG